RTTDGSLRLVRGDVDNCATRRGGEEPAGQRSRTAYSQIERTDLTLNWINLAILGTITLIPLPTGVLAAAFDGTSLADQRTAVVLCAVIAFFATAAWIPLFRHLQRPPGN